MIVVTNAGPLIALAQIGQFDILRLLYGQVHIPPGVCDEVNAVGPDCPGAAEMVAANWVHIVRVSDPMAVELLRDRLDKGESEAIVLAIELRADLLLIDEARGRRVAEARGLNKTGTIGTLILAKRSGLIQGVTPLLDQLLARGFRMGEDLYQIARSLADESN